jgi:hypothetical protein
MMQVLNQDLSIKPNFESSEKGPNFASLHHWGPNGGNNSHYSKEVGWLAITSYILMMNHELDPICATQMRLKHAMPKK